jgi:hypothetical protein
MGTSAIRMANGGEEKMLKVKTFRGIPVEGMTKEQLLDVLNEMYNYYENRIFDKQYGIIKVGVDNKRGEDEKAKDTN